MCTRRLPPCSQTVQPQLENQMNVGNPETAFSFGQLLNDSMGLSLFELLINNAIGVHPKALLSCDTLDGENKALADQRMPGHSSPNEFYIHNTAEGVATLAASIHPKHTIGLRGGGRYAEQAFVEGFAIEQGAVKVVQGAKALKNAKLMILFVHALDTARDLNKVLEKIGSKCGEDGLKVNMMAELPTYVFLAEALLGYFTDLSISSNGPHTANLGLGQ